MTENNLVTKVWNYATILKDSGVVYMDYVAQLTYLLFLKMDDERTSLLGEESLVPAEYRWDKLKELSGSQLEQQYNKTLSELSKMNGVIGTIYAKATNKINEPANLKRLVSLIDGETWMGLNIDVKGAVYEGLLEKKRYRNQSRSRTIFYSASTDSSYGGSYASDTRYDDYRPGLRNRRIFAGGIRLYAQADQR